MSNLSYLSDGRLVKVILIDLIIGRSNYRAIFVAIVITMTAAAYSRPRWA
jgi:hypothetical protein